MRSTTRLFRRCIAVIAISILAGCAGTRTVDEKTAAMHLANSDYKTYATQFLNEKGEPKYDPDSLLDTLEAGKAFNDAGMWQLSRDAFDAASKLLHWKEDTVDTPSEVANLMGTTLTSDAFGAYQGKIHQGSLIDYYQAINNLMLGQEADARVDFNRLQVRQGNAVAQLNAFASTTNKSVGERLKDEQGSAAKKSLSEVGPKVADGIKDLPSGLTKAKMRIAAGDVMSAVFRATSSAQSDKSSNVARDMLESAGQASATRGGNAMIAYLGKEIRSGKGELKNKVVVIYEDGMGPSLKEFRIDLPLFVVTNKVTYTGIALPQFRQGQPAHGSLRVGEGKAMVDTSTLTNINELAALEFDAAYKGIVAKAVISTIIKTSAQAAINHQIDKESGGGLMGTLLKVGVGATQYALTKADTRAWVNLPNTIQMAVVDRPTNGELLISTGAGAPIGQIELTEGTNTLVLIKAAGISGKPSIFKQELPAETIVAGL
jgi:hypothetical protein